MPPNSKFCALVEKLLSGLEVCKRLNDASVECALPRCGRSAFARSNSARGRNYEWMETYRSCRLRFWKAVVAFKVDCFETPGSFQFKQSRFSAR